MEPAALLHSSGVLVAGPAEAPATGWVSANNLVVDLEATRYISSTKIHRCDTACRSGHHSTKRTQNYLESVQRKAAKMVKDL